MIEDKGQVTVPPSTDPDMKPLFLSFACVVALLAAPLWAKKKPAPEKKSSLEQYVQEVNRRTHQSSNPSPGSLFTTTGRLADGFRDVRANQVYDLVTIIVADNSSAVSTGSTNTAANPTPTLR